MFLISLILTFAIGFGIVGFTYNVACPKCEGTGEGEWHMIYDFETELWKYVQRSCSACGGSGQIWMPTSMSFALIFFMGFSLTFLGIFGLDYFIQSWRLEWNPWVKDVEEMGFWFNPMFWTWLFYHDRGKWVKWNTIGGSAGVIFLVSILAIMLTFAPSLVPTPPEYFWTGWVVATMLMVFFTITWYLICKSANRSPIPRGHLRDLPSRL